MTPNRFPNNSEYDQNGSPRKTKSGEDVYDATPTSADDEAALETFRYRTFACPHCHTLLSVTKKDVGKKVLCPDCDVEITVPDYLDFETPTDYERQYYNSAKKERDRLLSPLTNPNREGLETESDDVYSVRGSASKAPSTKGKVEYFPVRCRICETLMQATSDMLGQTIVCPDCGAKTVVTDSLKKQQDAVDVNFQPRDRGTYDIGAIPEKPTIVFQKSNGQTVHIDPEKKTIAPAMALRDVYRKKHEELHGKSDVEKGVDDVGKRDDVSALKNRTKRKWVLWLEERSRRREKKAEEEEDLTKFLPDMVLRRKEGELVWSLPSPPKPVPLFNKTFQAALSEEIWARSGLICICLAFLFLAYRFVIMPNLVLADAEPGTIAAAFAQTENLFCTVFLTVMTLVASSVAGQFFWSVYNGGNSGARKVVEWRKEDLTGFFAYGLWFLAFLVISFLPGGLFGTAFSRLFDFCRGGAFADVAVEMEQMGYVLSLIAGFWLFFPVFWISTHQTDLPFCPITGSVFTSFFTKMHIWLAFYIFSAVFFCVPSFALCAIAHTTLFVFIMPFVVPVMMIFYGLFLGRLSWILDDEVRLRDYDD